MSNGQVRTILEYIDSKFFLRELCTNLLNNLNTAVFR